MTQAEGSYRKFINKLATADLLILDDWGLEPLNVNNEVIYWN